MEITLKDKRQAWFYAFRLRTLPLALSSIFLASFLAASSGNFRWEVLILASVTTILLQVLSNLANDYGDSIHGADSSERKGPIRAVQSGVISTGEMKRAIVIFSILALVSGLLLLYVALSDFVLFSVFLVIGLIAIGAAVTYTSGKNPYGYIGLGDLSVFIFFGLTGVVGTYFLHSLTFDPLILLPATSLGLFSTCVLNINNIRDIESDKMAGKKSIPVRIGIRAAINYNSTLILAGNVSMAIFCLITEAYGGFLFLVTVPLMVHIGVGINQEASPSQIDPFLKKMAIATLLWVLAFGLGIIIL
ncbi:1,4-dihydroxy-2-naphthoate polyprenyltransferase [Lunatibacter salilacus]|uniref:1,4-dihydroxy-2-naphthoate polyprenyltransferase n=1 Tax=Lunatibacter salilacus TaxID=2483804 RepID=UPI001F25A1EF|nr:1,4-dihydroxy-2-naphthoate polyprenyltransferase [Lunatibacter salilacus]